MKAQLKKNQAETIPDSHVQFCDSVCWLWACDQNCPVSFWHRIEHAISGAVEMLQQESSL